LLTAAMAGFLKLLPSFSSVDKNPAGLSAAAERLLQQPNQVLAAGTFFSTTLHLFLAIAAYRTLVRASQLSTQPQAVVWGGLFLVVLLLFVLRIASVSWGKRTSAAEDVPFLGLLRFVTALGAPFVKLLQPLHQFTGHTRNALGTPSATEEANISLDNNPSEPQSPQEKGLLKAIINFGSITVRQIMRARVDVMGIQRKMPYPALIKQIHQWGYSRLPVYTDGLDKIDGVLYVKDLLPHLGAPADFVWQNLIRTPYFVPETKKIDELLREFQERHVHMAIVVDEYGDTTGLLTLEDVIEEIVGEIHDELDDEEDRYYMQLDEHTFLFEGRASLHDFCKIMDPPTDLFKDVRNEVESVAGLMLRLFSRIPHTGEELQLGPYQFTIESADSKKIKKVRVHETVAHPENEEK
jgi:CBS domain containing-hemolysin-like protein